MTETKATWLPNLVGGISIWKLAQDLNAPRLFDGRLLVPETEGSDSLPVKVTWDLKDLLPLPAARAEHAADVEQGIKDLAAALERVAKEFADEKSGYHKFKDALTMPGGLGGEGEGESYFFDTKSKKVLVINWGASPRSIAGQEVRVFGWVDWASMATAAAAAGGAVAATAKGATDKKPEGAKTDEEKKKEEEEKKKKEETPPVLLWGRPLWQWALAGLLALLIALLIVWLLRGCDKGNTGAGTDGSPAMDSAGLPDGQTMLADGAIVTADGAVVSADASLDAKADGPSDASNDSALDAGDGGDAKAKDGGKDGGKTASSDDEDEGQPVIVGGGPGGTIFMGPGKPGGPKRPLPHRTDFHPDAVRWRVAEGAELLHSGSPTEVNGNTFNVTLKHGTSFEGVKTEWQDKDGNWHPF